MAVLQNYHGHHQSGNGEGKEDHDGGGSSPAAYFLYQVTGIYSSFRSHCSCSFPKRLPVTIVLEWSIRFLALIENASYLQLDEKKLHAKPSKACTPPPGVQAILMKWPTQIIRWFERDSSFSRRICVSQNFHPRNELTML
jgi:hypothetical protein